MLFDLILTAVGGIIKNQISGPDPRDEEALRKDRELKERLERMAEEGRINREKYASGAALSPVGGKSVPDDWDRRRDLVLRRDNWTCVKCGSNHLHTLHVHHRDPKATSENHSIDNLETLCAKCHGEQPGEGHSIIRGQTKREWRFVSIGYQTYSIHKCSGDIACIDCKQGIARNDFCYRAPWLGLSNRVCEDCFEKRKVEHEKYLRGE